MIRKKIQARPILKRGELEKVVDPSLEGAYDVSELTRLAFAASLCIRSSSAWRPTMTQVPVTSYFCYLWLLLPLQYLLLSSFLNLNHLLKHWSFTLLINSFLQYFFQKLFKCSCNIRMCDRLSFHYISLYFPMSEVRSIIFFLSFHFI